MGALCSKKAVKKEHYAEDDVREKKSTVTAHDRAVLDMKTQRDKLTMYQRRMETAAAKEKELARQLLAKGQKDRALLCLKKKKRQEQLLEQSRQQMDTLQQMIDSVEFAQMEQKVFASLEEGNKTLKALNDAMSVEKIDALMDETDDALAVAREIEEAISGHLTPEDDAEIEEELAALDELEEEPEIDLPDAPTHKVEAPEEEEEEKKPEKVLVEA